MIQSSHSEQFAHVGHMEMMMNILLKKAVVIYSISKLLRLSRTFHVWV